MDRTSLETHLNGLKYDWSYQDINCISYRGYSQSWQTWEHIKFLVDWSGKRILDYGCHHGYFCFKITEQCSNTITVGIDINPEVIQTTKLIKETSGNYSYNPSFFTVDDYEKHEGYYDENIILCLNVLHHFKDIDKELSKFKCKQAIFEINRENKKDVEKYFNIVKELPSHRTSFTGEPRIILLGEPKC